MKNQKAFTLIEVLVTMAILSFGILGVLSMQFAAMNANSYSSGLTDATTYAGDKMEKLLNESYAGLVDGSDTEGEYTITWDVTAPGVAGTDNTKSVLLTVSWTEKSRARSVAMYSIKVDLDT